MRRCIAFIAAVVCVAWPIYAEPMMTPEAEYLVRDSIAEDTQIDRLIDNPGKIMTNISTWKSDGHYFIRSETDFHTVIPVPMETVIEVLEDYDAQKEVYGRVRDCRLIDASGGRYGPHIVRTDIFISVLGFGDGYSYITNNVLEKFDGAYVLKYNLIESVDDKLYEMIGSWYVEPVFIDGVEFSYIRQYSVIGIQRGSIAMEIAMRTFGTLSLKQMIRQLSHAAEQRVR